MAKGKSSILFRLVRKVNKIKTELLEKWNCWKYINLPLKKKIYLIGTPLHNNIGDSAIVLAELAFLKKCGYDEKIIKELTVDEVMENKDIILRWINRNRNSLVCWHGGGNLGNQWHEEEEFRRCIMSKLPKNRMIIFPQTIYYTDNEAGKKSKQDSLIIYDGRKGLTMIAREKISYKIMRDLYSNTEVLLTPDIVLSLTLEELRVAKQERTEILLCLRNDVERALKEDDEKKIIDIIEKMNFSYRKTDMYTERIITKENREACVYEKMQEFMKAKLVITDRLHGMVFSAITGTPCIVFSNYNHKVLGTYEWIEKLPYINFVENIESLEVHINQLLQLSECKYDNSNLKQYFERIESVVKKAFD